MLDAYSQLLLNDTMYVPFILIKGIGKILFS